MRLESFKRRITSGNNRVNSERSSSIDSTDDDAKIRLDDPSLRLNIMDSSPTSKSELTFSELCPILMKNDPNMNTTTTQHSIDDASAKV